MPTPLLVPALISAGAAVAGVASQSEAARKAANAQRDQLALQQKGLDAAQEANKPVTEALNEMLALARGYDPSKDTATSVDYAASKTADTLANVLRGLNASYRSGGGVPGLSTEFNVKAQGITDRVADPLREFAATQKANEFAKKMAALQMVNGGNPGNLAANFFAASQNSGNMASQYNPAAMGYSLGALSDSLSRLFPTTRGGAGGTGDVRGTPFAGVNQSANQELAVLSALQAAQNMGRFKWGA